MGELQHSDGNGGPTLKREAQIPLPPAARRPCILIGLTLAMVFFAATVDAFLWQHSAERNALTSEAAAAELQAASLATEIEALRAETRALNAELRATREQIDRLCARLPANHPVPHICRATQEP